MNSNLYSDSGVNISIPWICSEEDQLVRCALGGLSLPELAKLFASCVGVALLVGGLFSAEDRE